MPIWHAALVSPPRRPLDGLDRLSRSFWRATGRRVALTGGHAWLDAPVHDGSVVGDAWLTSAARRRGGQVREDVADGGLLPDLGVLDGPGFSAAVLHPEVRDFYEHTSRWRMKVGTQWSAAFQPGGELVSRLFARRVQQLALPMRPLDVAHGMDSRVAVITDGSGAQRAAGWIRSLRSSGALVFSGCYSSRVLPGADRASVHVTFPLEAGNVQVFLRPTALPDGSLRLDSPPGRFGTS